MDKHLYDVISYLAESGVEDSMKQIVADLISNGYDAVTDEQAETILRYLDILAKKDDHYALLALGTMYYSGMADYVQQDYIKAIYYYEKAAEKSELTDRWALNNLGYCYYYGRAGEVDYEKAYSCFALAATNGNSNSMYKLGDMYYYGHYVEKDYAASFYWYMLAKTQYTEADSDYQGFLDASISMRLGRAFLYGEGTIADPIQALFELRTAEVLFYKQLLMNDPFSTEQLPKVRELIKTAHNELDSMIKG